MTVSVVSSPARAGADATAPKSQQSASEATQPFNRVPPTTPGHIAAWSEISIFACPEVRIDDPSRVATILAPLSAAKGQASEP